MEKLQKTLVPHWKSKDGLKIPRAGTPERQSWDDKFHRKVVEVFAGGDANRLRPIRIPVNVPTGSNRAVNADRLRLYTRMARAGEQLPPVVVRKSGQGYHLIDGNHRQAAAIKAGQTHLHALELIDAPVKKSIASTVAAGMMALSQPKMPAAPADTASHRIYQKAWSAEGLHPELFPIAHLESSFGQHIKHAQHTGGEFHTAVGALGLKPVTAHEEYLKSPALQQHFPGLTDKNLFVGKLKSEPGFYNAVAGAHWLHLKSLHGTAAKAAYAWRHGTGAARHVTDSDLGKDPYVKGYQKLAAMSLHKSMHPAFRDPDSGKVHETPGFHDIDALPEDIRDKPLEEGFTDADGNFIPREKAVEEVKKSIEGLPPQEVKPQPLPHADSDFEDEDGWVQEKYRRGGEAELERLNQIDPLPDEEPQEVMPAAPVVPVLEKAAHWTKQINPKLTVAKVYRAYKHTPHQPDALVLKYAINRAENENFYKTAAPEQIAAHEKEWLAHHQAGGAAEKNGHITVSDLQKAIADNPKLVDGLRKHQQKLHEFLKKNSHWVIRDVDGEPSIALSRGYKVLDPGPDHQLASYSDDTSTASSFGAKVKKWWVPLKNIWYSYDHGPKSASSTQYGPENEFLASPHGRVEATTQEVVQAVPRNYHGKDLPAIQHWEFQNPNVSPQRLMNVLKSAPPSSIGYYGSDPTFGLRKAALSHPNAGPEHISQAMLDPASSIRMTALQSNKSTAEHVAQGLLGTNEPQVRAVAAAHRKATPEHIAQALKDSDQGVRGAAITNNNASADNISQALGDEDDNVRERAISHKNATAEHAARALGDVDPWVRRAAVKHKDLTSDYIGLGLKDSDPAVRMAAAGHLNASAENLTQALMDKELNVRREAVANPNIQSQHITQALRDTSAHVRIDAISNSGVMAFDHSTKSWLRTAPTSRPIVTPEHISMALKDPSNNVRERAINHSAATAEHLTQALKDPDASVREAAIRHVKVTPAHVAVALKDPSNHIRTLAEHAKERLTVMGAYKEAYKGLSQQAMAKSEFLPVDPLKTSDSSLDRILALKSKHVQPHDLREALGDEDPDVRQAAALHPALTPELIAHALQGDDQHLKSVVLTRPDLRSEDLQHCLHDPELSHLVLKHPAISETQRLHVAINPELPVEHRVAALANNIGNMAKNIGYITYPNLGVATAGSDAMAVPREKADTYLRIQSHDPSRKVGTEAGGTFYNVRQRNPVAPERQGVRAFATASASGGAKSIAGNEGHENQHVVYAKLKQRYGASAVKSVIHQAKASLEPQHRELVDKLFELQKQRFYADKPEKWEEESITHLQNYLQDPDYRAEVHQHLQLTPEQGIEHQVEARKAWQQLIRHGQTLTPEHLGVTLRKTEEIIADWVAEVTVTEEALAKGKKDALQMYGGDAPGKAAATAATFLTGRTVSPDSLREYLMAADGDPREAVLGAYGLNTPEGRKALEGIEFIREVRKSMDLSGPKSVTALVDRPEVAAGVMKAFQHDKVEDVKLGGKHSSGTKIAEDFDGGIWLLKPGSGNPSPAAGVDDSPISQSRREAGFAAIAHQWGIGEVPEVVLLSIDGKETAAIRMLPPDWVGLFRAGSQDAGLVRRVLEPYRKSGHMHHWAVLDWVLGNADRHGQNLLVGPARDGNPVALIDHGSSFAGPEFSPGTDKNSFVAFYLRAWAPPGFHGRHPADQLRDMPVLDERADAGLRAWVLSLNENELSATLIKYGIDPKTCLDRLAKVKAGLESENFSRYINQLWVAPSE